MYLQPNRVQKCFTLAMDRCHIGFDGLTAVEGTDEKHFKNYTRTGFSLPNLTFYSMEQ